MLDKIKTVADVRCAFEGLKTELAERAAEMDQVRHLPADLAQKMAAAGIFRIVTPSRLGGLEASARDIVGLLEDVSDQNASAGWCAMIASTSCLNAAYVAPAVAQEIYGDPMVIAGSVFAPMGKAELVDDNYVVNGRWSWGSGSANCSWIAGGCVIWENGDMRRLPDGAPEIRMVIFPADAVQLADDWHVSGLRGTGSGSFEVKNLKVPVSYSASLTEYAPWETGTLYKFPAFGLLALGVAAIAMGNARGAINSVRALATLKKRQGSTKTLAERGTVQRTFATMEAGFRAARAYLFAELDRVWSIAESVPHGEPIPVQARADLRLACTFMTRTAADTVRTAYELGGGTALFETSDLQRRFRDAYAITQHIMTAPDTYEMLGRVMLDIPGEKAMI